MRLFVTAVLVAAAGLHQATPSRDAGPLPTPGTASISGIVVTDEPERRPVRRAIVTLSGDDLRPNRGAITDDEGRFRIERLPAGRFTLVAARAAFVTSAYGARRPGRPGTPIVVGDGVAMTDLIVRLWRGAVVAGVVRDEHGEAAEGVEVSAVPAGPGARRGMLTLSNNGTRTNDRGEYRIFGLEPGSYLIAARPTGNVSPQLERTEAQIDAAFARLGARSPLPSSGAGQTDETEFIYAPIYHPGTPVLGSAVPIRLEPGQEAVGLDFALQRVRTVAVEGTLARTDGRHAGDAAVELLEMRVSGPFASEPLRVIHTKSAPDGTFRFTQVTPGRYQLLVRAPMGELERTGSNPSGEIRPGFVDRTIWAMTEVDVAGADTIGLALTLEPALVLAGRVVFEGDSLERPTDLGQIRIALFRPDVLRPSGAAVQTIATTRPAPVRADGTFTLDNLVPGQYRLTVSGPPIDSGGWWPKSAMHDGRDLLDGGAQITPGSNPTGVVVTLTDRRSELSGTLQTRDGAPASDVFVIAYSADRAHWGPDTRRVQAVRPGVDGRYALKDLPAGDYLVAALTDVDEHEWQDPAFLEQLVTVSVPVAVGEGERKVLDLRVGG